MLIGAFAAIAGTYTTGSVAGGVIVALAGTMAFAAILAFGATWFRGDPIVIGIGSTCWPRADRLLLRILFGVSGTFTDPAMQDLPRIVLRGSPPCRGSTASSVATAWSPGRRGCW